MGNALRGGEAGFTFLQGFGGAFAFRNVMRNDQRRRPAAKRDFGPFDFDIGFAALFLMALLLARPEVSGPSLTTFSMYLL